MKNKVILITGGTGSFGTTFIDYLIKEIKFKKLIIYSRDEFKQHEIFHKINIKTRKKIRFFIGDVRDKDRLKFATSKVDIIIHAAALKQVNTAEYNPWEFIKTNVLGAQNVIDVAIENKVEKVLALSTDKAADPISLYGATKFTSDKLFQAANNLTGFQKTIFSVVRYGNVINSRGSFIPILLEKKDKPNSIVNITHKEMTRFFISKIDSVKFVKHCVKLMKGGEIFVPKLPSTSIYEMAKIICQKAKFQFTGLRPGEKLHEVMCPDSNSDQTLEFKNFYCIKPTTYTESQKKINYNTLKSGEKGKKVNFGFNYNSKNNSNFLKGKKLNDFLKRNKLI